MKRKLMIAVLSVILMAPALSGCGQKRERTAGTTSDTGRQNTEIAATSASSEDAQTSETATASGKREKELSVLQTRLEEELKEQDGEWAVCVEDVNSGERVSVNNHKMVSASLIKLYIAGAYYDAVQDGMIEDTYSDDLDIMLNKSDNDAANTLIDLLGYDRINAFSKSIGATDTLIQRKMLDTSSTKENYTSVEDCTKVLDMVLDGKYVNSSASKRILQDLKDQERTGKIPAGVQSVQPGVKTANKTGELDHVENDAAIVWGPDSTYILVVMSGELTDTAAAREEIQDISAMVYEGVEER